MYTTTFEEPRAWAMEWDGAALAAADALRPATEVQTITWQRMTVPPPPPYARNGAGVFADPQSWALGWEGTGLADAETWQPAPLATAEAG